MTSLQIIGEPVAQQPQPDGRRSSGAAKSARMLAPQPGDGNTLPEAAEQAGRPGQATVDNTSLQCDTPGKDKTKKASQAQNAIVAVASAAAGESPFAQMVSRLTEEHNQPPVSAETQPLVVTNLTTTKTIQMSPDVQPASPITLPTVPATQVPIAPTVQPSGSPIAEAPAIALGVQPEPVTESATAQPIVSEYITSQTLQAEAPLQAPPIQTEAPGAVQIESQGLKAAETAPQVAEAERLLTELRHPAPASPQASSPARMASVEPFETMSRQATTEALRPAAPQETAQQQSVVTANLLRPQSGEASTQNMPQRAPVTETQLVEYQAVTTTSDKPMAAQVGIRPSRPAAPTPVVQATGETDATQPATTMPIRGIDGDVAVHVDNPQQSQLSQMPAPAEPLQVSSVGQAAAHPMSQAAMRAGANSPADQVVQSLSLNASLGRERIVIRLDPPELGSVRLTLHSLADGLRGVVEVDNSRTMSELQHATPPLLQRLAEAGIQVRRLDVVLTDQGGQSFGDAANSGLRDSAFAQQQGQHNSSGAAGDNGPASAFSGQDDSDNRAAASYVSDDSINVWI